jgi:hypothetical protein
MSWLGDETQSDYDRRHNRVRRVRGKASAHPCAGACGGANQAVGWATMHDRDGEDPEDYLPLCGRCHHDYDDRSPRLREAQLALPAASRIGHGGYHYARAPDPKYGDHLRGKEHPPDCNHCRVIRGEG